MCDLLESFLDKLSRTHVGGPVTNQYALGNTRSVAQGNAIRRANLSLYLRDMMAVRPVLLLIGEAPGYRGCRLTGVPFTSETIILSKQLRLFGSDRGYRKSGEERRSSKEATATILWSVVSEIWPPPLLWNAFPFHPHRPGNGQSNRRPSASELDMGTSFLDELLTIFGVETIAAVGRVAESALNRAGIGDVHLLRHPSHGGKVAFEAGLGRILATLST